jgi:hypothetical protein
MHIVKLVLALILLTHTALAQVPLSRPESVSISSTRLARMDHLIADEISKKRLNDFPARLFS